MDTKQLYRLSNSKFRLTNWLDAHGAVAQSDATVKWYYCGIKSDYKLDVVCAAIDKVFKEDELYLCISSGNSYLAPNSTVAEEIGKFLHKKEVIVMNESLTKMIFFNSYGTFEIGIIQEYPPSRAKPEGKPLEVKFHANMVDNSTSKIASVVRDRLETLEKELNKDYGGPMEHLWIDLELVQSHLIDRGVFPFRFQKRVDIPSSYTEAYSYNVGHYSFVPNFEELLELSSDEEIVSYVFRLLYESTATLLARKKTLGDFNAAAFRAEMLAACVKLGYIELK